MSGNPAVAFLHPHPPTGIKDIQEIVNKFLEAEEQNFSLFNYVNDINSEIERLEHAISNMRSQIEKYRGQGKRCCLCSFSRCH